MKIKIPLIVDEHMHARDEGLSKKYTFKQLGRDCIRGGVGWVGDMPNNKPPTITAEDIARRQNLAQRAQPVQVFSYATVVPGGKPIPGHNLYKAFVDQSFGGMAFDSYEQLRETFENFSGHEISVHCEDPKIIAENKHKKTHEERRPAEAESHSIERVLDIAYETDISLTVTHISTKEGLNSINLQKDAFERAGLRLRAEACYHHFILNSQMRYQGEIDFLGLQAELPNLMYASMNPPLRSEEDRKAIWYGVLTGDIDAIASDNAPHLLSEKQSANPPSGITILPYEASILAYLLDNTQLNLENLTRITHTDPMRYLTKNYEYEYLDKSQNFVELVNEPFVIKGRLRETQWCYLDGLELPWTPIKVNLSGEEYEFSTFG